MNQHQNPELRAKCTRCKKTYTATKEQVEAARQDGVLFSPCCQTLATVEHVRVDTRRTGT